MESIELKNFWENVRARLLDVLPENIHPWIFPLEVSDFEHNTLTLVTGQIMGRDILRKNYYNEFVEAIKFVSKTENADVIFIYDEKSAKNLKKENEKLQKSFSEKHLKEMAMENLSYMQSASNLNLKYKFENFVIGESNKFAYKVALSVAQEPAKKYNPLFIYGNSGLGKTHLMQAIGHHVIFNNSNLKVKYTKMEDYVNDFISHSRKTKDTIENMSKFNKKYTNIDIILIDDVQFIESKTKTMIQMQHTFDTLYNKGKQIVITSDRLPKEIPTLTAALCSRFEMGLMVELISPDFETRLNILKKMAEDHGLIYTEDALIYIAENFINNVRELEGAFNKICAYSEINEQNITLSLVQEVLNCKKNEKELTLDRILDATSKYYELNADDIKGSGRSQNISVARHIAMYLSRELTQKSFIDIAEYYNKQHSTVMFAYQKIKKEKALNKDLTIAIREIKQAVLLT